VKSDLQQVEGLYTDVEWALAQGLSERDLVPMLQRLAKAAPPDSEYAVYAQRYLAELLVRRSPFRAARLARGVLRTRDDDRAFAVLGLAHLLMGNYRSAEKAYRSALRLVPHCPWYAHNLGHLLDVGLSRPAEAIPFLRLAKRCLPHEPEIASSLAHALLRSNARDEALAVLIRAGETQETADRLLRDWAATERAAAEPALLDPTPPGPSTSP
jgi:Flp pilus assembly protein TadD